MESRLPVAKHEAGTLIDRKYLLERKLGEGGMGEVWAAHHELLDTPVAIKLIRADIAHHELGPRLLHEARAAAKLGHPAIVRVFDVGQTAEGDPFIVMELLEGESLAKTLLREQRLSATDAVRLLLPIADALRVAHAKGIVHRDIKPDNVFLVQDETGVQPKLVDFGIAKHQTREFDSKLTQKGVILGSPDYMAPEQARGDESIDQRADIWSFCVLLYELVSGAAPFDGANYNALMRAILETTPPSLVSLFAGDAEFSRIVETGMAKDPASRFQSMQELGEALARWLLKQGVFEDAAGGAIEAKWVVRRTDPGYRQSRPSFGSIPGFSSTAPPLVGEVTSTERRLVAEAPTSVGPVVTGTSRGRRRLLLPVGLGCVAVTAAVALFWRSSSPPARAGAATAAAVRGVAPHETSRATAETFPRAAPRSETTARGATSPSQSPSAATSAPAPRAAASRLRPRPTAPTASAGAKPGLDLMTPY